MFADIGGCPLLSYRHSYHAGNFADVLKHIVMVEILEHFIKKDKAFEIIDTHAGAGLYQLQSDHAQKLSEFTSGIEKMNAKEWPELASYFAVLKTYNKNGASKYYPGSPLIACHFLRRSDRAWFFELHPTDFNLLKKNTAGDKRVRVQCEDGFKGMLALLPTASRRCLALIDPSYEVKTDYAQVLEAVVKAYKKSSTTTFAIWYPVVDRYRINQLEKRLIASGIRDIQRFELGIAPDTTTKGMTACGMFVINPPWTLLQKMAEILPRLVDALGQDEGAFFKCDVLVGEESA